jgi:tight adherence protein B
MADRETLAKFNSLLQAGLSLDQAEVLAEPSKLSDDFRHRYRYLLAVCEEAGGSPLSALSQLEQLAEQQFENSAKLRVSGTVPKATASLVLWLPLGAALLGQIAGLRSIEVFFESWLAFVSLLLGLMLLLVAQAWSARIVQSANRAQQDDEILLDAVALVLDVGLPPNKSIVICAEKFEESFARKPAEQVMSITNELFEFAQSSGGAISKLFRNRAELIRKTAAHERDELLERVSIRLLAPMAIFVLPAFVLIAVVPISIALLTAK